MSKEFEKLQREYSDSIEKMSRQQEAKAATESTLAQKVDRDYRYTMTVAGRIASILNSQNIVPNYHVREEIYTKQPFGFRQKVVDLLHGWLVHAQIGHLSEARMGSDQDVGYTLLTPSGKLMGYKTTFRVFDPITVAPGEVELSHLSNRDHDFPAELTPEAIVRPEVKTGLARLAYQNGISLEGY